MNMDIFEINCRGLHDVQTFSDLIYPEPKEFHFETSIRYEKSGELEGSKDTYIGL